MFRFAVILFGLMTLALPAQAALVTWDISGTARTGSSWFGVSAGDRLTGSVTFDDNVSTGRSRDGDIEYFDMQIGNTLFDMSGGTFSASYQLRDDDLFKLNIQAKPQEFRQDKRQFKLNLAPHQTTLKVKDLGNRWMYVDNIAVTRQSLALDLGNFNSNISSVAEPASLALFATAFGMVGLVGLQRRRRRA